MRPLPAELIEHYQLDAPNLIYLVKLEWPSGTVRAHTGIGDLMMAGETWTGVGNLGGISDVTDDYELGRSEITVELSGFDRDLLRESFRRDAVGRTGIVYAAVRDAQGVPIEASLTPLFAGYMADIPVTLGDANKISVTLATDTAEPSRKTPGRYTDESHRRLYPGDHFYRWSAKTSDRPIYWGNKRDAIEYK